MNQVDQNINKDMSESSLIDVESLDFSDDQTWLYKLPEDSGERLDVLDWCLSLDWPVYSDEEYAATETQLQTMLDEILRDQVLAMPDKHKFDSRTYVKPKKRPTRPSIQAIVESSPSQSPNVSLNTPNKYLTYNKYLGIGPMMRLKTFNVDTNTDNSGVVKDYAMKRRSLAQDDDPQLEDMDMTLCSDLSERLSSENTPSRPINIDLSQPANNIHSTFNKGMLITDRPSLTMYRSGESLNGMSPPSLVCSLVMEKSLQDHTDTVSGLPSTRDSFDPMMTSMTLSILDEKDMSTSFLSQTTYPDHDSLMDSLPPSLVSSVNSSYVVSRQRNESTNSPNIFSSATFTNLEHPEKLLTSRPRHQMYNSLKRETPMRNSESYTKAKEEACQIDSTKVLNENIDKVPSVKNGAVRSDEMSETVTLHYSNNKFRRNSAEKENLNSSFKKDDAFFNDMGIQRNVNVAKNSLNVTLDKQELNEIIQARQKLSLARKALPTQETEVLPNQVDMGKISNQTVSISRKSTENASELLSRRRFANGNGSLEDAVRDPPKRNATFKKLSPRTNSMDATIVFVNDDKHVIDINSETLNLINTHDKTLEQEDWNVGDRAMVVSSESTDTNTFSSSSPPDCLADTIRPPSDPRNRVASTPLVPHRARDGMEPPHSISPIYHAIDNKSYTMTTAEQTEPNTTIINTATIVRQKPRRELLSSAKSNPDKKSALRLPAAKVPSSVSHIAMPAPTMQPKKTGLPTSKFRQYSSHRDLRTPLTTTNEYKGPPGRIPLAGSTVRSMSRRAVYASNPALSPTAAPPARRDSYTIAVDPTHEKDEEISAKPVLTNPPVLVRQGTETLRRERPQSQLVQPKEHRALVPPSPVSANARNLNVPPPVTRPYSVAGPPTQRILRPASSGQRQLPGGVGHVEPRPMSCVERGARPSRLPAPAPRRMRPPSVYSVAPTADVDQY